MIQHVTSVQRDPPHSTGVLVFVNEVAKLPDGMDGVIDMTGGRGGVYEPSCPCILCCPLSLSLPNIWVMAYLYTIIRETHTSTLTVESHQNKTRSEAAALTQLQSLFTRGLGREGVGGLKGGKRNYYVSSNVSVSQSSTFVTNLAKSLIWFMAGWDRNCVQFECNLLPSAPIGNGNHNIFILYALPLTTACSV